MDIKEILKLYCIKKDMIGIIAVPTTLIRARINPPPQHATVPSIAGIAASHELLAKVTFSFYLLDSMHIFCYKVTIECLK
jgi:hypothetical protein